MEFEQLKKIWNSQNNKPMYAINEEALHNHIRAKKNSTLRVSNKTELLLIIVNLAVGIFAIIKDVLSEDKNIFSYLIAVFMFATAVYVWNIRLRRRREENQFERSILGDLDHAISNARYQVRLSRAMLWYVLPLAILTLLLTLNGHSAIWKLVLFSGLFIGTYFAGRWEHGIYVSKKRALEGIKDKLVSKEKT